MVCPRKSSLHCHPLLGDVDSCVRLAEEVDEEIVGCHWRLLEEEEPRPKDEACPREDDCETGLGVGAGVVIFPLVDLGPFPPRDSLSLLRSPKPLPLACPPLVPLPPLAG